MRDLKLGAVSIVSAIVPCECMGLWIWLSDRDRYTEVRYLYLQRRDEVLVLELAPKARYPMSPHLIDKRPRITSNLTLFDHTVCTI